MNDLVLGPWVRESMPNGAARSGQSWIGIAHQHEVWEEDHDGPVIGLYGRRYLYQLFEHGRVYGPSIKEVSTSRMCYR